MRGWAGAITETAQECWQLMPVPGTDPIFGGAADFDLELVESRILDGRTQGELTYRPTIH